MANVKQLERQLINQAASNFLSEQEDGDLYDAYQKLVKASEEGQGDKNAGDFIIVWQVLEYKSVDEVLDLIDGAKNQLEEEMEKNPINKIDFTELRTQKRLLLEVINNDAIKLDHTVALEGILHMIDAIQDYAVDQLGWDEKVVFDFEEEENREKNLIGYQVVNHENTIHPAIDASFCIYSVSQVKEMVEDSEYKFVIGSGWRVLPIYEGDIENPTFMFEGDPNS